MRTRLCLLSLLALVLSGCGGDAPSPRVVSVPQTWALLEATPTGGEPAFALRAPPGTRIVSELGTDSFVGRFDGPVFDVLFDLGLHSNSLGGPREARETLNLDGRAAYITANDEAGPAPFCPGGGECSECYLTGLHVPLVSVQRIRRGSFIYRLQNRLTLMACVPHRGALETAAAMFRTVSFAGYSAPRY
jgi:hypothetical protein